MDGIVALLLSKKFTKDTVIGMGAIKGAACQVQSINKVGKTTTITLKWEDNVGVVHTQAFDIEDGLDGVSIQNATIKPNGHLELTLSDGNTIDCGKVLPQYDTMPTPSSSNEGQILQYIGTTTSSYTNGYFYQCVESPAGSGTYIWVQKNVQPNNGGGGGDGVVDGYYNSADQLFYEDSAFLNPIAGEDNTIYIDLNTNGLYRYDGTIFIKVSSSVESIQVTTLPIADVTQLDKIYQYIGATDTNYTNGYFYKCKFDGTDYYWDAIPTQNSYTKDEIGDLVDLPDTNKNVIENIADLDENKENVFRYAHGADIPAATASNVGTIIQYIGSTTPDYNNGFFYQSQLDSETGNYNWVNIEVQPASGTSAVESVNNKTGVVVLDAKDIGLQVTTMPTADIDHLGNIVQYIGATDVNYTNGRFYKCVYDGVSTYSWVVAEDYISKSGTVGLVKNDGSIDQSQYAKEADLAQEFSTATNYVIGDYVTYLGNFYKFTSNHNAGAWDSNDVITVDVVTLLGNKTDKVSSATNGNFAGLDASGNLTDSGKKANDFILATEKGAHSGVAELDSTGKVPSSQLPSYIDDVIDGYYNDTDGKFYEDSSYTTEIVGESGKIYISVDTDIQYRWTGTAFAALGGALQLGETSSTAYRGDRGKIAYDHSQITDGSNPHNTTADNVNLATSITVDGTAQTEVESALGAINTLAASNKTNKADKVDNAINGHLAGLDSNGNLTDSGVVADDVIQKVATATGLLKDDGAVDTTEYQPVDLSTPITTLSGSQSTVEDALSGINDDIVKTFTGTQAQWDALSLADKQKYEICNITDDGSTDNVYTVGEVDALLDEKLSYADNGILGAKNLLKNTAVNKTGGNVAWVVNADKSVTINTSESASSVQTLYIGEVTGLQGDYILNGVTGGSLSTYGIQLYDVTTSTWITQYAVDGDSTINLADKSHTYRFVAYVREGVSVSNITIRPMLRLATDTDSTYVPYVPTNAKLNEEKMSYADNGVLGAKNILPNNANSGSNRGITYTVNSDKSVTANGTATGGNSSYTIYEGTLPTGKYLFSGGVSEDFRFGLRKTSESSWIGDSRNEAPVPITIEANVSYSVFVWVKDAVTANNVVFKPMLRLASDPDDTYQPYAMTNSELTELASVKTIQGTATNTTSNATPTVCTVARSGNTCQFIFGLTLTAAVNVGSNVSFTITGLPKPKGTAFLSGFAASTIFLGQLAQDSTLTIRVLSANASSGYNVIMGCTYVTEQ